MYTLNERIIRIPIKTKSIITIGRYNTPVVMMYCLCLDIIISVNMLISLVHFNAYRLSIFHLRLELSRICPKCVFVVHTAYDLQLVCKHQSFFASILSKSSLSLYFCAISVSHHFCITHDLPVFSLLLWKMNFEIFFITIVLREMFWFQIDIYFGRIFCQIMRFHEILILMNKQINN